MKSFYEMLLLLEENRNADVANKEIEVGPKINKGLNDYREGSQGLKARTRRADWLSKRASELESDYDYRTGVGDYENLSRDANQSAANSLSADLARKQRMMGRSPAPHDKESEVVTSKMQDSAKLSPKTLDNIIHSLSYKGDLDALMRYVDMYPEDKKDDRFWGAILGGGIHSKSYDIVDYALGNIKNIDGSRYPVSLAISNDEDTSMLTYVLDKTGMEDEDFILYLVSHALVNGRTKYLEYLFDRFPKLDTTKLRDIFSRTRQSVFPVYPKFGTDWRDDEPSYEAESTRKKLSPALNYLNNYLSKRYWGDNPNLGAIWKGKAE